MGKPAARLTDNTAHGGLIMGPGCPTVLIGKMPAATLGDMHVCPMMTPAVPPIPHVGGPIMLGSTGVFIGKKPAARLGDMCMCVGPPSTVIMGCMTVLIGEAGSGSQAGAAGAAAAAQAAKMKGPKSLEPFPAEEPGKTGEMHFIQSEFADAGGKVFQGAPYQLTDPDKKEPLGASSSEGGLFHDGFAKAGSFKVKVPALSDVKWAKETAGLKDKVKFSAKADGFEDGAEAQVFVFEETGSDQRLLESYSPKVSGGKVSGEWGWKQAYLPPDDIPPEPEAPLYRFLVVVGGLVSYSNPLKLSDKILIKVTDPAGKGQKDMEYEAHFASGEMRKGKLDGQGEARIENADPRRVKVRLPKPAVPKKAKPAEVAAAKKTSSVGMGDVKEAEGEKQAVNQVVIENWSKGRTKEHQLVLKGSNGELLKVIDLDSLKPDASGNLVIDVEVAGCKTLVFKGKSGKALYEVDVG